MLVSNEGLRRDIEAWAHSVGLDLSVLADAAYRPSSAPTTCAGLARACARVDADATGCAGQGIGALWH